MKGNQPRNANPSNPGKTPTAGKEGYHYPVKQGNFQGGFGPGGKMRQTREFGSAKVPADKLAQ